MPKNYFKLITAVYLLLRKGDEVLLLRRANTGYQDGKYSLVAGHLDGGESASQAMAREAKEEVGIDINPAKLKFVHLAHRLSKNQPGQERLDIFYELWEWTGEIKNLEPEKCSELAWYSLDKLPTTTIPFVRHVIEDIKVGVPYSEYEREPE